MLNSGVRKSFIIATNKFQYIEQFDCLEFYEDDNKSVRSVIALEPRKLTDAELNDIYMQIMQ